MLYRIVSACLVAAATAGCAGNGAGLDANGNPVTGGGGTEPLSADFKSIQDNVFTPICTKCHIGAGAPEGLQLDSAHSYSLLVGVPSTEQPNVLRVAPGNPDNSYIVLKLQGSSGISGARMPFGGPYLPQSTIDVIRQWITNGAMNSAAATVTASVRHARRFDIVASSPDRDSIASAGLARIVISFSSDIDFSLINATTVSLERLNPAASGTSAPDGILPPRAAQVPVVLAIPAGNPSALLITPRAPLVPGTYRVTLKASLADMNAAALGSDYSFRFTLETSP